MTDLTGRMMGGGAGTAAVLVYLAFLAYLVVRIVRRPTGGATPGDEAGATEYLLAGRALSLPAFVGTLVTSWYGGILGVGEWGYGYGISSWIVFGVPYYLAAILFALFVAGRARRSPFTSIPDALTRTYGPGVGRIGAAMIFLLTAPAAYVLMLGTLFGYAFGWPGWVGIVLGTVLSLAYVVRGGLRAVVRTDVLQFALMFVSFALAVGFLVVRYGIDPIRNDVPATHWSWHGGNPPGEILVWYLIALATLVEPAFYQRVFAARTPAIARRGIFISLGFWIVFDAMSATTALYARALIPDLADPVAAYPALAAGVFPAALAALFFVGMLAIVMSTVDTNGFIAATTLAEILPGSDRGARVRAARWGILATGLWSALLAISAESVIGLWYDLGSIGTAALLLPMLGVLYPRVRVRSGWAPVLLLVPAAVTALWRFGPPASWDGAPAPIYVGLGVSVVIALLGRRRDASGGPDLAPTRGRAGAR